MSRLRIGTEGSKLQKLCRHAWQLGHGMCNLPPRVGVLLLSSSFACMLVRNFCAQAEESRRKQLSRRTWMDHFLPEWNVNKLSSSICTNSTKALIHTNIAVLVVCQ